MRYRPLIAAFVLLPSIAAAAAAQRGSGSAAGRKTEMFDDKSAAAGPTLRVRDIEDQSPLKLLIDKRKDLKLSDAQLSQLKDAEPRLKDRNASLLKSADSLLREMKPSSSSPSDADRERIGIARARLMSTVDAIRANNDGASKDAIAPLDLEQQTKANEMLARQREEFDRLLRSKLGGDNRG
ncbi:MAG TPA: hypothetical protein VII52_06340 [Gemmatimonadaceae bacterium]